MDPKDLRIETAIADNNNGSSKYICKPIISNNKHPNSARASLAKMDVQARPCAVIGPDRILPPPSITKECYAEKITHGVWSTLDDSYQFSRDYVPSMNDYQNPSRNISPRQTFQENMQRIIMPPRYSAVTSDDTSIASDECLPKSFKPNVEPKYCDVPYNHNVGYEQKNVLNQELCVNNINSDLRTMPQSWQSNVYPVRPYGVPEYYQYADYSTSSGSRVMPVNRQHRQSEDVRHLYPEQYFTETNPRFRPYPTFPDKYAQSRYEYINNLSNTIPPTHLPLHKVNHPKSLDQKYHSQVPYGYIDPRMGNPVLENYRKPNISNYNVHLNNGQGINPNYQYPMPTNSLHNNKIYPPPYGKNIYNNELFLEHEYLKSKNFSKMDNLNINDMNRTHINKTHIVFPNQHSINFQNPNPYINNENPSAYRCMDPNLKFVNSYARMPPSLNYNTPHCSPLMMNDSTVSPGNFHLENDFYSKSIPVPKNIENCLKRPALNTFDKYACEPNSCVQNAYINSKLELNKKKIKLKNNKNIDVRQFLQMWNEGDDENIESANNRGINNSNSINTEQHVIKNQDHELYVLGLINVPKEDLSKYEHIQKVSKLPENIKGYNSIELLNQFEEAIESSELGALFKNKSSKLSSQNLQQKSNESVDLDQPLSPLDVEAKISQSVIHKEVGCNFEIKPCSPKIFNAPIPVQNVYNERTIEKVTNTLIEGTPSILNHIENNSNNCFADSGKENPTSQFKSKVSCKLAEPEFTSSAETKKDEYILHDLESSPGLCLASLPRLDNDIELNFPEVNQQFINANKIEVIANKPLNNDNAKDIHDIEHSKTDPELISKLSKYRRHKKNEDNTNSLIEKTVRTNSVIIKNPESQLVTIVNQNKVDDKTTNEEKFNKISEAGVDIIEHCKENNKLAICTEKCLNQNNNIISNKSKLEISPTLNEDMFDSEANKKLLHTNIFKPFCLDEQISSANTNKPNNLKEKYALQDHVEFKNVDTKELFINTNAYNTNHGEEIKTHSTKNANSLQNHIEFDDIMTKDLFKNTKIHDASNLEKRLSDVHVNMTNESKQEGNLQNCSETKNDETKELFNSTRSNDKCGLKNHLGNNEEAKNLREESVLQNHDKLEDTKTKKFLENTKVRKYTQDLEIQLSSVDETKTNDSKQENDSQNNIEMKSDETNKIFNSKIMNDTCDLEKQLYNIDKNETNDITEETCPLNYVKLKDVETEPLLDNTKIHKYTHDLEKNISINEDKSDCCKGDILQSAKLRDNVLYSSLESQTSSMYKDTIFELTDNIETFPKTHFRNVLKAETLVENSEAVTIKSCFNNEIQQIERNITFGEKNSKFKTDFNNLNSNEINVCQNINLININGVDELKIDTLKKEDFSTNENKLFENESLQIKSNCLNKSFHCTGKRRFASFIQKLIFGENCQEIISTYVKYRSLEIIAKNRLEAKPKDSKESFKCTDDFIELKSEISQEKYNYNTINHLDINKNTTQMFLSSSPFFEPDSVGGKLHFDSKRGNVLLERFKIFQSLLKENLENKTTFKITKTPLKRALSDSDIGNMYSKNFNLDFANSWSNKKCLSLDMDASQPKRRQSFSLVLGCKEFSVVSSYSDDTDIALDHETTPLITGFDLNEIPKDNLDQTKSSNLKSDKNSIGSEIANNDSESQKFSPSTYIPESEEKEMYVHNESIETMDVDDIAEDIEISVQTTPGENFSDSSSCSEDVFMSDDLHEYSSEKIKSIYGSKMCSEDIKLLEKLYKTPQMDVNKTLLGIESQISNEKNFYYDDDDALEKILSDTYDSETPRIIFSPFESELKSSEYTKNCCYNALSHSCFLPAYLNKHKCGMNNEDELFSKGLSNINSPEVSSTTEINRYKSPCKEESYKYANDGRSDPKISSLPLRPLITKGAQKYIPPSVELGDFKVRIPLPKQMLERLQALKSKNQSVSKIMIKSNYKSSNAGKTSIKKSEKTKCKPNFEDVLKSIDEIQIKMLKAKSKKVKKTIPKVVIKKSVNGSHYTSARPSTSHNFNPDLTGRKWQPWVFLEKNKFVDKMVLKNKSKAIFSHRKNTYILADRFRKYKSVSRTKLIISKYKYNDAPNGELKYTIRFKNID